MANEEDWYMWEVRDANGDILNHEQRYETLEDAKKDLISCLNREEASSFGHVELTDGYNPRIVLTLEKNEKGGFDELQVGE